MSRILEEITTDRIGLAVCLQRLLVIANKTENADLAKWCTNELNGYPSREDLPFYRKKKSRHIVYSGINGGFQVTNQPLLPGYLKEETVDKAEDIGLLEGIQDVQKRMESEKPIYRDLTALAGEVHDNTKDEMLNIGVQCISIKQMIDSRLYSEVYEAVKIRIINLLCSYEAAGIKVDKIDVASCGKSLAKENRLVYDEVIVNGRTYSFKAKESKFVWSILVPILVGIVSAVASGLIVFYLTR